MALSFQANPVEATTLIQTPHKTGTKMEKFVTVDFKLIFISV